ncbi:hypothetical protein JR316_0007997 [Psilocybe cubensis]|uniref:Uncharacterized protein n=2 Tax=Psilocybe cubensis TaxID=181762 RepID=A0A8H8CI73_PSICU|nr:hypothetical protein JR316_0007997 [Psilocybe cubensis]KAH9479407.1 hypothetical protein JR316_0007997 [Psilocybe cubensis]
MSSRTLSTNPVPSPGEQARRKRLLDDPLVTLLSPSLVECTLCTKQIKLSSKSAYDTHHWFNHRSRCLRMKKKKQKQIGSPSRRIGSSPLKTASSIKASLKDHEAEPELRRVQTPPLVELSDSEDSRGSPATETSYTPKLPPLSPPPTIYVMPSENVLEEYIYRYHPGCTPQTEAVTLCQWQKWSWAQLKLPQFVPPLHGHPVDIDVNEDQYSDSDSENQSYGMLQYSPRPSGLGRVVADLRDQEAAHALSMLSRSH